MNMKRSKHQRRIVLFLALSVLFSCLLCGCVNNTPIGDNITVAGVNVGGLTRREAIKAVREAVGDSYETTAMEVTVDTHSITLSPEMTGAALKVSDAVDLALSADADTAVDISSCLNLNSQAIEAELKKLMETAQMPMKLCHIGLCDSQMSMILKATKDIRDKYVWSRLAWDLGILDEMTETAK